MVLSVPTFAQENSDNVIRVGSFEETYNTVNEKGERSGYGYEYLQDIAGYARNIKETENMNKRQKILIVDDAKFNRDILKEFLC